MKNEKKLELGEQVKKELAIARNEIKEGKFYTFSQVKKLLKIK